MAKPKKRGYKNFNTDTGKLLKGRKRNANRVYRKIKKRKKKDFLTKLFS